MGLGRGSTRATSPRHSHDIRMWAVLSHHPAMSSAQASVISSNLSPPTRWPLNQESHAQEISLADPSRTG